VRVLVCIGGGIGNVVMATPAMAALASMGHRLSAWLLPDAAGAVGLLRGWAALDSVTTGDAPPPTDCDLCVHTAWSRGRGVHPREISPGAVDLSSIHETEANMIPVRSLGYAGPTPRAHAEHDSGAPRAFGLEQGRYVVLASGCNPDHFWKRKRWGGWDSLARELIAHGLACVFPGTDCDRRSWMSGPVRVDLTGRTTMRQAAGIVADARCVIAIDCGLAHVAAALGVPTVVLFGATSEVKNRPLGPRVRVMTRDIECRPCQMTPAWDSCPTSCRVRRCMAFDPAHIAGAVLELAGGA